MANLLKLSEATALALHTMVMVGQQDGPVSASPMAVRLSASEAHVFKVLQQLVKAGLLRSKRGPNGGYVLARPPEEITLMDVYEVFEGPMRTDGCLFGTSVCGGSDCIVGGLIKNIRAQVVEHFSSTTLEKAGKS